MGIRIDYAESYNSSIITKKKKTEVALSIMMLICISFSIIGVWASSLDLPIVKIDSVTGKCLSVETSSGRGSCDVLPGHYDEIKVAPK